MHNGRDNRSNVRRSVLSCTLLVATVATLIAGSAQMGTYAEAATPVTLQSAGPESLTGGYPLLSSRLDIIGASKKSGVKRKGVSTGGLQLFRASENNTNEITFVEEPSVDGGYVEEFHGDGTYIEEFHGDGSQTDTGSGNGNDNVVVIGDGGAGDGVEVVTPDEAVVPDENKEEHANDSQTHEWPVTRTQTVSDSEDKSYTVTVTFGEDAGIPHEAELKVSTSDATESRVSSQHAAVSLGSDEFAVADWFLDVTLEHDGQVCVPIGTVEVVVDTDAIDPSLSDAVEVVVSSSVQVSENQSGSAAKGHSSFKFSADQLGEIGFTVVERKSTEIKALDSTIVVWAPRSVSVKAKESFDIPDTLPSEGIAKIGTLQLSVEPSHSWPTTLYITSERSSQSSLEDGLILSVEGKDTSLFGIEGTEEPVAVSDEGTYLVEWDTGCRDATVNSGEAEIAGPLPIGVEFEAADVRADYSDAESVTGITDGVKYGYDVIGAYDLSFLVGQSEWKPDEVHKEQVTIRNVPVGVDHDVQVWHLEDEGFQQVEEVTFTDEGVSFFAADDGTYVLVDKVSLERVFTATDDETYRMTVTYDGSAGMPRDVYLEVSSLAAEGPEYLMTMIESAKSLGSAAKRIAYTQLFDISLVDPLTGVRHHPSEGVSIEVELLSADVGVEDSLGVVNLGGDPAPVVSAAVGPTVGFDADGASTYAVVVTALEKVLKASDGKTYEIAVTYDSASGIPADASLEVTEIIKGDEGYEEYVAESVEAMGVEKTEVQSARAFDITFVDSKTREVYQPTKGVEVSIRLLDESTADDADLGVVHFPSDGDQAQVLDSSIADGAVEFGTDGFSVFVVVQITKGQTITASDGNRYNVTVTYDASTGIPEDAELVVSELTEADASYAEYVERAANAVGADKENYGFAYAFDISLVDPATGTHYQPTKPLMVSVRLLNEEVHEGDEIGVVHFTDSYTKGPDAEASETELLTGLVSDGAVEFESTGFSVYVIIDHEDGKIHTPRVEFHFLSEKYENPDDQHLEIFTASPFYFVNKKGTKQNSEIVKNGETLEVIMNPPNIEFEVEDPENPGQTHIVSKYFFGWYIVNETGVDQDTGKVTYTWMSEPEKVEFEKAVTIDPDKIVWANEEHTAITSLVWELNGVEHTAENTAETVSDTGETIPGRTMVDEFGCVHVYLAPIYQDYYFVNFHAGDSGTELGNSIINRRLVVLGSDEEAEVRIGDVTAPSEDMQHKIFTGWQGMLWDETGAGGGDMANQEMTTLDEVGDEYNSGPDKDGFYITVGSHDLYEGKLSVDLYPIFTEARWFHFRTGGRGATYVGDTYVYTTDQPADVENGTAKYYLTDMATSSRTGYRFKGWYADAQETDSYGDYIDGIQITDENGRVVNSAYTKYADEGQQIPLYQLKDGRLYVYKALDAESGVTLYAHWEEITDASIQVIVWKQKVGNDKAAYDYQKTYDFDAVYTVDTYSGMTLSDLQANNVLQEYENKSFTGFHYRTTTMKTDRTRGDGSTVVDVYYDRDLMTIYFYYNGSGDPSFTYTETSADAPAEQYGIVEGEYVPLIRKQGSGMRYNFRYAYTPTTSDTIVPQFALVSYSSGLKLYEELTREVNTVTNTRWKFQTGSWTRRTTRYMDQGTTDGKFYVWQGGFFGSYVDSGYTVDDPPPANDGKTYYCYYNYRYYEVEPQSTTTTNYTWKLNGNTFNGTRYRRLAGTEEYSGALYTVSGHDGDTFGIDSRGGYVELDGTQVSAYQWYAMTHVDGRYEIDNLNDGTHRPVYGLVDGEYVRLTPIQGDTYTYATANTYTTSTVADAQYGLVDGEYVPLTRHENYSYSRTGYTYTNATTNNGTQYGIVNGAIQQVYRYGNQWRIAYSSTGAVYNGYRYTRANSTSTAYSGVLYAVISETAERNQSGFTQTDAVSGDNLYGKSNNTYFQLRATDNSYYTLPDGTTFTGVRYTQGAGAEWTGERLTRTGDAAPYAYASYADDPSVGQELYVVDGNGGHVPLNWSVNVTGHTYTDESGVVHTYTGDRYSYRAEGEVETEYTGARYTRASVSGYTQMLMYTGLYGQTLEQAGYTSWPDMIGGTSYNWYSQPNSSGSRLTFLDAFLFADLGYATNNNTVLTLYGSTTSQSGTNIYFYKQNLDGTYPAVGESGATNRIPTSSSGTFTFTNKYNGFELDTYSTNNGSSWSAARINNSASISNTGLHIRFKRLNFDLIFDPNYPTLAGTTIEGTEITLDNIAEFTAANTVTLTVPYGTPLSDYSTQSQPAQGPDHYTFSGWYVDSGCTTPYTFNEKMPDANMRLYAGWTAVRFRIKIDPNGGEFDHINHKWNNSGDDLALRGYADSGAAWWWVDNGDGTRTAKQYSPEAYNPNTWTPFENFNRRQILAPDGTTVERAADSGWAATSRYSTYINANYMATISEYTDMKCEYVPISDAAAETYEGQVYYYMNAQFQSDAIDGTGLPSANRSALYLTEDELHAYYLFYANWMEANEIGGYTSGTTILDEETWRITYVSSQKYRHTIGSEHYTFLGWYKLDANGNPESMPYNFADPVTGEFTLKAFWRLDAQYQIRYHADYTMPDGTIINGSIPYWTDPQTQSERYADNAETEVYRQPTGITANNIPTEEYIFRGWQLVSISANSQGQAVYTPIEPGVYYDPGDPFTIRAAFADRSSIIHMQAVYEYKDSSYRRPHITNLALNANGGFLTLNGEDRLMENTDLSDTWDGVVGTVAATVTTDAGDTALIEFGDIQSNEQVRLYRYATEIDHIDGDDTKAELDPAGKNYFKHPDNYFLLGFDDESNEGDYIATYPADSVIAVPRNEKQTIYAVWEPLVYIKVVNDTDVGPVTFGLSSDEGALQVVNARNGLYGRTPMTADEMSAITVENGDYVWLAVPYGVVKEIQNGQTVLNKRHVSFEGTNSLGPGWLLTAACTLDGTTRSLTGTLTDSNADYTSVQNQKSFGFSDELEINPEGIVITFTAIRNPHTLVLDDNYPTTGVRTREIYFDAKTNESSTYDYDVVYGPDETLYYDLPSTSTRVGYIFLGWDLDPNWISSHNPKTDKPAYTTGSTAGWRISSLNDFFDNGTEREPVKTLYAVWDTSAESKIVYVYKDVPEPGDRNKEFGFSVALSGRYNYERKNANTSNWTSQTGNFNAGSKSVTLKHGEYIKIISSQFETESTSEKPNIQAKIEKYSAEGALLSTVTLRYEWNYYSASNLKQSNYCYRSFSFHDLSYTVTENDYSASQYYDTALACTALASDTYPLMLSSAAASVADLPVENVEGRVLSWTNTEAGGRVVFTNTRQTADVTVKKELVSNTNTAGIFNYTASYTLDGRTTALNPFTVTSGTDGKTLKDIPVGAQLTVTELGQNLNDYTTTVKIGDTETPVTETTETANGSTTYKRSVAYTVARSDATITYTNTLKSYPITFYKVKQDGTAGVPSYFKIASSTGLIAEQLYPLQTGTGEFFPNSTGKDNHFYVGSYTLTETFVGSNFLPLEGPVTLTLSANNGGELESSNTDYVKVEKVNPADPTQGFKVTIYNQQIVKIKVAKTLKDPILSGTRTFLFRVQYKSEFLGKTITYDNYDPSKENNGLLSVLSGSNAEVKVPVGATGLTISEDTSSIVVDTTTIAEAYDTSVQRKPKTGDAEAVQPASSYSYTSPVTTDANDGDTITFTNTRKTVNITVKKTVIAEDDGLLSDNYAVVVSVRNGALPIRAYNVGDDLDTDDNGDVSFTLRNNEQRQIEIPVGASVLVRENLTDGQKADDLVPFILMPGGKENMSNGDSSVFELLGPTEDKDIRIFNVPAICKVTSESDDPDEDNALLYNSIEGEDTPDDTSDDIYMPAVFGTIKSAFNCINGHKLYLKNGSGESATYSSYTGGYKVKMLRDYDVPNSDVVEVNSGFTLTFTTAGVADTDGYPFRRSGAAAENALPANVSADESIGRAILTREPASTYAFFTVREEGATEKTTFTMSELIVDGDGEHANPGNAVKGGCLTVLDADVTIDHCVVYNFKAKQGGAVYTTGDSLKVNNTVFDTCVSGLSGNSNGGGAINTSAKTLTIDGSSFRSCTAVSQGGAVYQHGKVSNWAIDADGKDKTAVINNCSFDSCSSRAGGGCQLDVGSVTLTGCAFKNCTATVSSDSGGNGGGLNNYTADFKDDAYLSKTTLVECTFEDCVAAKNAENVGTPYGGGMRSDALETKLSSCTFTGCKSEYDGGGAAFTNNKTGTSTTVEGCVFTSCTAENGGGIYSVSALTVQQVGSDQMAVQTSLTSCEATNGGGVYAGATTTIGGDTAITSCEATNGGGVYAGATTTIGGDTAITSCKATNGGGVYVTKSTTVKGSATISSCEATANGGGVYVASELTILENSSISANKAGIGAGVYVSSLDKKNTVAVSGGSITANEATISGGGIAVGGTNVALNFSGTARVGGTATADNNIANDSQAEGKRSNVCLNQDSNTIIYATNNLSEEAYIGVYTPGEDVADTLYDKHGKENKPFGTDSKNVANLLNHFVNDRNTELVGGRLTSGDKQIYWLYPICKITDGAGNLLYKDAACTEPALYFKLGMGDNKYDPAYAFNVLINNGDHPLYSAKDTPYTASEYCIKMLVENYNWEKYINVEASKTVAFTTAGETDAQYPYRGTPGTFATITRTGNPENNMFTSRGTLIVTNVTLDGGATMNDEGEWSGMQSNQQGGILINKQGGRLVIGENATLRNSYTTGYGGAVANDSGNGKNANNSIIIQGGRIEKCGSAGNGGAVYVGSGKLEMTGGEITTCRASLGSAVYVAGINEVGGAYFAGGSIEGNTATGKGGGAVNAAENNAKRYFYFGALKDGNVVIGGNPVIKDNVNGSEERNVVLDRDANTVINTTADGLNTNAYIGVYVTGNMGANESEPYKSHGDYKDDFGTYDTGANGMANLDCFVNDRNNMLGEVDLDKDYLIRWSTFVCKITRESDKRLLYYKNGKKTGEAKFLSLSDAVDNLGKLYTDEACTQEYNASTYTTAESGEKVPGTKIEMLVDHYEISRTITIGAYAVTLTTATKENNELGDNDHYMYTGSGDSSTIIAKAGMTQRMFWLKHNKTVVSVENLILDGNRDNRSCNQHGAIFNLDVGNTPTLNLKSGAILQNSSTSQQGGAVDCHDGTLNMYDGAVIKNCRSTDASRGGGAVHLYDDPAVFNMFGGKISDCSATNKGGAVYIGGGSIMNMSGGMITSCVAPVGSAIYMHGTHSGNQGIVNMSGGEITGNTLTGTSGGAIQYNETGHEYHYNHLNFSGNPLVYDNYTSDNKQANVYLAIGAASHELLHSTEVISVVGDGLSSGAKIGVWPVHDINQDEDDPFGITVAAGANAMLTGFVNDYWSDHYPANASRKLLVGWPKTVGGADQVIWRPILCKIVDQDEKEHVFTSISVALEHSRTYRDKDYVDGVCTIEMLTDYTLPSTDVVMLNNTDNVKLVTAPTKAADEEVNETAKWAYHYIGSNQSSAAAPYAIITRGAGYTDKSMFTTGGGTFAIEKVILDGAKATYSNVTANGGIINVSSGTLSIGDGATLRNSIATNGGAVYVARDATAIMTAGTVNGNNAILNGAGVYLAEGATLNLSGNPNFGGTDRKGGDGADKDNLLGTQGNFVLKDSTFKLSDMEEPKNGSCDYPTDNGSYKVRQDIYVDGYLGSDVDGNLKPATSLNVTGEIINEDGANDGSIWVWAQMPGTTATDVEKENNHYQQLKQFAVLTGDYDNLTDTKKASTISVFRNAADDARTENSTDSYLTGSLEGDFSVPDGAAYTGYVYWTGISGSRRVILRKVDGDYDSAGGKTFVVHRGTSAAPFIVKDGDTRTQLGGENPPTGVTLAPMVSSDDGVVWVGNLPFGWYIVEETTPHKYFFVVVTESGTFETPQKVTEDGAEKEGGYDNLANAQAAAKAVYDEKK